MHKSYLALIRDEEAQRNVLRHDKTQKLEGICAELCFQEHLLHSSFEAYSAGWWFQSSGDSYRVIKLCVQGINELTVLDHQIIMHLHERGLRCYVVEFARTEGNFYGSAFIGQELSEFVRQWPKTRSLHPPKKAVLPTPIGDLRKEDAIRHILHKGLLFETAVERLFANFHLSPPTWDIDYFAFHNGRLIGFEMKQKYPIRNGNFGLNTGLVNLFRYLAGKDVEVAHVILTKPIWDDSYPAIHLYSDKELKQKCLWLGALFGSEMHSEKTYTAPSKTSYGGNSLLNYHNIAVREFSKIGEFGSLPDLPLLAFLGGNCPKLTSLRDISEVKNR
ncbi:hypothetical protein [uncultured Pontibacter sp.]|uniref:hypothetical protein n=1 Tax=uncultured Pontibacter sp. TaxID=453356 RepID=UPI00260D3F80|nr:hypothetical protein [uncultured Pontibacter sp.]